MKILITGGAGFVGSHFVSYILKNTDWEVHVIDDLSNGKIVNEKCTFFKHDIRKDINLELDYNYIIHLAAEGHVDRSIKNPIRTAEINIMGTLNVLEFARKNKYLKKLIFFSTDEVFGDFDNNYDDSAYHCTNPYSATKAAGEELCRAYYHTYKLPIVVTHSNNIFGEYQQDEALIPLAYSTILSGKTFTIHTNKGIIPKRSYIYIEDVCDAIFLILENSNAFEKFNIGIKEEYDILSILEHIGKITNKEVRYVFNDTIRPYTDKQYKINNNKIINLGWTPRYNFFDKLSDILGSH